MMERFKRQLQLPGFNLETQHKLQKARVLVVGAGGLGCPVLIHLASAGIGFITIADFDTIDESNLSRQWLYGPEDIGKPKASTAAYLLKQKFPDVQIDVEEKGVLQENILDMVQQHDVVVDCTDSIPVRYMLNDACEIMNKPWVYAGVFQYEGQISVFNYPLTEGRSGNYRDIFPFQEGNGMVLDCNAAGVLCTLTGILGTWQANEVIKIISGIGTVMFNRLMLHDIYKADTNFLAFERGPRPDKNIPILPEQFLQYNYQWNCERLVKDELTPEAIVKRLLNGEKMLWVDVRESHEMPKLEAFSPVSFPLSVIESYAMLLPSDSTVICFCQSGIRSLSAVNRLQEVRPELNLISMKGGILAWEEYRKHQEGFSELMLRIQRGETDAR